MKKECPRLALLKDMTKDYTPEDWQNVRNRLKALGMAAHEAGQRMSSAFCSFKRSAANPTTYRKDS